MNGRGACPAFKRRVAAGEENNAGVLLSGRLTVVMRTGERLLLEAGDTIMETVETWHQGMNEHDEAVELIVFYAGVADAPLTLQEE